MLASGTLRGRIGYAPGHWLFYATGGLAWSYDQSDPDANRNRQLPRTASSIASAGRPGVGIETAIAPSWTVRGEYLWTDFPDATVNFPAVGTTCLLRTSPNINSASR